ncbi:hypothetical protein H0H92_013151 [Tricholoma furcatifolium]|nr:hypothetical protein H0H92_013151 [Tricholoma furcatifolium]
MPLLTGLEGAAEQANPTKQRVLRPRKQLPPADTGRPETSKEFAARMKRHFVLRGPKERKEGGGTEQASQTTSRGTNYDQIHNKDVLPVEENDTEQSRVIDEVVRTPIAEVLTEAQDGIDLVKQLETQRI